MSAGGERYAYIASLRGIAALSVIAFHTAILPIPSAMPSAWLAPYVLSGNMAVSLFYCLSAYTLALTFERSDRKIVAFYLRRFFRIAPLFYVVTIFYVLHFGVSDVALILQNLAFIFNFDISASAYRGIATGGWSIGVEMPFYLAFPFLVRYASTLRRAVNLTLAFLAVSYGLRLLLFYASSQGILEQYGIVPPTSYEDFAVESFFGNLPYFGFGLIAYRSVALLRGLSVENQNALGYALVAGSIVATIALPQLHGSFLDNPIPLGHAFGLVFTTVIAGLAFSPWPAFVNRVTVFCGEISYSLYLVHIIVIRLTVDTMLHIYASFNSPLLGYFATFGFVTVISVAIAYLTYRLIERPGIAAGRYLETMLFRREPVNTTSMQPVGTTAGELVK